MNQTIKHLPSGNFEVLSETPCPGCGGSRANGPCCEDCEWRGAPRKPAFVDVALNASRWVFLERHWQSTIGGIPLHRWLDEQTLRFGGLNAAIEHAMRYHDDSERHIA